MLVEALLFIILSPGLFLTLPPDSRGKFWMTGHTSNVAVAVHGIVYGVLLYLLQQTNIVDGFQANSATAATTSKREGFQVTRYFGSKEKAQLAGTIIVMVGFLAIVISNEDMMFGTLIQRVSKIVGILGIIVYLGATVAP